MRRNLFFFILLIPFIVCGVIRVSMDKDHILNTRDFLDLKTQTFKNKYPIILHHGVLPIFTLHKIARDLREKGFIAYSTQLTAANTIEYRSAELMKQIQVVLDATHASKVNIIAHSMGGIDARNLISRLGWGSRVASLSTIGTPHRGTVVAEPFASYGGAVFAFVARFFVGLALDGSDPFNIDPLACFAQLTPNMMAQFNQVVTNDAQVYYQSWAGVSGPPSVVPRDWVHFWSQDMLTKAEGPNDGIVSVASAQWGEFKGTLPAAHASLVGKPTWIGGDKHFNALKFFEGVSENLVARGY